MMGRLVLDYRMPLKHYAPVEPPDGSETRHNPQDIIPSILEGTVLTLSRKELLGKIQSLALKTSLAQYFGINLARSTEEQIEFESQLVRKYSLRQVEHHFNRLMQNPLYARDVKISKRNLSWDKSIRPPIECLMSELIAAYRHIGWNTTNGKPFVIRSILGSNIAENPFRFFG